MCAKCNVLVNNGKVNDFRSLQYVGIQRIHTVPYVEGGGWLATTTEHVCMNSIVQWMD